MSVQVEFDQAAKDAKSLPSQSNETLLQLYALFKQATSGDVSGPKPGAFDFKGKAKYDAWTKLKGQSQEQAMQAYVDLVARLKH
jgi:diazepam-binding inhibitor (GABA receptor modulator, acyl-CoA-binding protein)